MIVKLNATLNFDTSHTTLYMHEKVSLSLDVSNSKTFYIMRLNKYYFDSKIYNMIVNATSSSTL